MDDLKSVLKNLIIFSQEFIFKDLSTSRNLPTLKNTLFNFYNKEILLIKTKLRIIRIFIESKN